MAHRVSYIEKNGLSSVSSFPTLALAVAYARTRKNAIVVEGGADDVVAVVVKKCGTAEEEIEKREALREARIAESMGDTYTKEKTCACGKTCTRGYKVCIACYKRR